MIMLNQTNQAMDIVADILADEQENTISSYQYNGVELTPAEPVTMRNTFLLTIFNPASFLILRADKSSDLEYDEFQREAHDLTLFYLYTGPRGKEGLLPNFTWDCVEQGSICFPETKNYQARTISIIKPVADVLESRKKLPDGPFNFTYNQLYKRIKYVIKAAGIENAGPHTLRKTAGAFYYMATRDIYATKEWMGHSDISITIKHYSGLMQSMKREDDLAFENLLTAQLMGQL